MKHFVELKNEAGHVMICPLWKLPQLVAAEIETKKADIEAVKAQEAEKARIEAEMEQARQNAALAEAAAVNAPMDLSADPGF